MEHKRLSGIINAVYDGAKILRCAYIQKLCFVDFFYLYEKINLKIIEHVISFTH